MIKTLINDEKLDILKAKRNKIIFVSLCFLVVWIIYCVASCFIQNRDTMKIFIVINSIVSIIVVISLLYALTQNILPLNNQIKLYSKALSSWKTKEQVKLVSIQTNKETYLGVEANVIYVSNINKEESRTKIFIDEELEFKKDVIYEIEYYHNFLISIKEVSENE